MKIANVHVGTIHQIVRIANWYENCKLIQKMQTDKKITKQFSHFGVQFLRGCLQCSYETQWEWKLVPKLRKLGCRPGGYGDAVEDYWLWPGRSLMRAHPYLSWLSSIKALKLVKAVAGLEKWFWRVHQAREHDTREHGAPKVRPAWCAGFQWRACKSIFRILHPFSQNIRRK